jgi:diaminohydroxyphosphoribosylaminopyrimidine deaminase/5-amino-6-(5-phosphoribosylamino)uracil reductase
MNESTPKTGDPLNLVQAMKLAISEGRRGMGWVSPNPPVGCVILGSSGELLSTGYHRACGESHAEIEALEALSDKSLLQGATLVVTLEPCAHQGRTPSCARHLAQLPLKKVVYGLRDPNPMVAGKGHKILEEAGVEVELYTGDTQELEELVEVFFHNIEKKMPFTSLKVASSLDGMMAMQNGESQWITSEEARAQGHWLRGVYDAVLIGVGTYLADNPGLDARHEDFSNKVNRVVLLDPQGLSLKSLPSSRLVQKRSERHITVATLPRMADSFVKSLPELDVLPLELNKQGNGFHLETLLKEFLLRDICSLYVEGGQQVYSSFLMESLVQRLYLFFGSKVLGGKNGLCWTADLNIPSLANAVSLDRLRMQTIGDKDFMLTGRIRS